MYICINKQQLKNNMKKFDFLTVALKCRQMYDPKETLRLLNSQKWIVACWGAHDFTNMTDNKGKNVFGLRFKVSGYKHKGFVYITVNGNDLYDFYLVTSHGNLKKAVTDVYFDDLISHIDGYVETNN